MKKEFETIIRHMIGVSGGDESLSKIDIPEQFQTAEKDSHAIARNLNAAFLIALSGEEHPLYDQAVGYLSDFQNHPFWEKAVHFFKNGLELISAEVSDRAYADGIFEKKLNGLYSWIADPENLKNRKETIEKIYGVFFPEGAGLSDSRSRKEKIDSLREKRKISISGLNSSPVSNPAKQVLFTSNILVTIPSVSKGIDSLPVSSHLRQMLREVVQEEQMYWYDHPIPIGVTPEHNEVLYGLEGLDEAVGFEKKRGALEEKDILTCVLSVSVTHEGLQNIVKEYLEDELKKEKNIKHLDAYVFTETETIRLVSEILVPAAEKYLGVKEHGLLYEVIGVDGEYGRHYSFLKAVSAFWQVFIAPAIKGTFKIDLDQVFPQEELLEHAGSSAFANFRSLLWGAEGTDSDGSKVELGMIAGALVNRKDIGKSLFYPDVCFPEKEIKADESVFFSMLPQALSTEAEMMTRYSSDKYDGKKQCIQRIHVTGGTNGILIDSLRKYQPFTPTFVGRAEDQAYILSSLFNGAQKNLRYVHEDGLIMRHDKEAFVSDAIKMAATGKLIGDYIRILIFSYYVNALPWSFDDIKKSADPFTGCFMSKIPLTVVYLRFALKAAAFFESSGGDTQQGFEFLQAGLRRLDETVRKLNKKPNPLIEQFNNEKQGWKLFYDILDIMEKNLKKQDPFAIDLQNKAKSLIRDCKISFKL